MQKVLRRTKLAKAQAARKAARQQKIDEVNLYRYDKRQQKPVKADIRRAVRGAREAQREDWTLGALAPKRDVGEQADKYGTVSIRRISPGVDKADGWWKDYYIVEGDRVVIVERGHRDRGKIGVVKEVKKKAEQVVVEGLNEVDVAVPEYMLVNEQDKSPHRTVEAALPLSSVNLIYPMPNPKTGELRDVIIKELRGKKAYRGDDPPERCVAGLDPELCIPYPEVEPAVHKDHDNDTFRIEVEKKTWVPTLIRPPMPPSIIDELRNKYSKFRDRHDEEFVRRKTEEDEAVQQRKKEMKQLMMSPLKELHKRERAEKKARGKQELSEEALSSIGQHIAKSKGLGVPLDRDIAETTASGMSSPTPSRATFSAKRSTSTISKPPTTPLNARSVHSNSHGTFRVTYKPLTRYVSTIAFGASSRNLASSNAITIKKFISARSITPTRVRDYQQGSLSTNSSDEVFVDFTSKPSVDGPWKRNVPAKLKVRRVRWKLNWQEGKAMGQSDNEVSTDSASNPSVRSPEKRMVPTNQLIVRKVSMETGNLTSTQEANMLHDLHKQEREAKAESGNFIRRVTALKHSEGRAKGKRKPSIRKTQIHSRILAS